MLCRAEARRRGCPTTPWGRVLVPILQTGSSATRPRQCRKQAGTQGSVPRGRETLLTQPQGRPLRKRNASPQVCNGWGGCGAVQSVRPAHHAELQSRLTTASPAGLGTRTLDSSWGGCASLNPLPTLGQSPPRSECSLGWPPPPNTHVTITFGWAHSSPPGPGTERGWFTRALPMLTAPYVRGREGCPQAKPRHGVTALRPPVPPGGVGSWASNGGVCAGPGI